MKKLSAYTVASNCTDLTDIRDGIAEIHEAMKACVESGKRIPSFYVYLFTKYDIIDCNRVPTGFIEWEFNTKNY